MAEGLSNRGWNCKVLTSCAGRPSERQTASVVVSRSLLLSKGWVAENWISPINLLVVVYHLIQFKPDFIYLWNLCLISPPTIMNVLRATGLPCAVNLGDYWLGCETIADETKGRWLSRKLRRMVNRIWAFYTSVQKKSFQLVVISDNIKSFYLKRGFDSNRIKIIRRGIPANQIHPCKALANIRQGTFRLVFTGRLTEEKGVRILLQSLALLYIENSEIDLHLDIFGKDQENIEHSLKDFCKANNLQKAVTFGGMVSRESIRNLLPGYHAAVAPTVRPEPFGNTSIEAMASGVPIIASRSGGFTEVVRDGMNGLLVEPGNPIDLKNKIKLLYYDEAFRRRLCHFIAGNFPLEYTLENSIEETDKHLHRLINQPGRSV